MITQDSLEILGIPNWLYSNTQEIEKENEVEQQQKEYSLLIVEKENKNSFLVEGESRKLLLKMLTAIHLNENEVECISVVNEDDFKKQQENFIAKNYLLMGDFQPIDNTFITNHPSEVLQNPEFKRDVWEVLKKIKNA